MSHDGLPVRAGMAPARQGPIDAPPPVAPRPAATSPSPPRRWRSSRCSPRPATPVVAPASAWRAKGRRSRPPPPRSSRRSRHGRAERTCPPGDRFQPGQFEQGLRWRVLSDLGDGSTAVTLASSRSGSRIRRRRRSSRAPADLATAARAARWPRWLAAASAEASAAAPARLRVAARVPRRPARRRPRTGDRPAIRPEPRERRLVEHDHPVDPADLTAAPFAIVVQKSAADPTVVACADVTNTPVGGSSSAALAESAPPSRFRRSPRSRPPPSPREHGPGRVRPAGALLVSGDWPAGRCTSGGR